MTASSLLVAIALTQTAPPVTPGAPPAPEQAPQPPAPPAPGLPVLTLQQALAEGRRQNLDVQQAEAKLQQARQLSWKAWSYYLPQVSAGGSFTHNSLESIFPFPVGYEIVNTGTPPGLPPTYATGNAQTVDIVMQPLNQYAAQGQVTQAVIAPALWPAIQNAYTAEKVAELNTENARREVLYGIAQVYYGAAGLKQAVEVTERQLAITRERERDARVRYQAGTTPKVALLRAEIDRAQAEQDLIRARNNFASAKIALATLLDRRDDFDVEIPPSPKAPAGTVPDLQEEALRDRPDVQAAAKAMELAEGQRTGIYYQYAPSIGAFARGQWVNFTGFAGKEWTWAVGLALTWNLFDGGLREADLREAQARVVEASAASRSAQNKAVEEVRQARLDLESALANKAKAVERVTLARENQQITALSYRAGAATYLETTDAVESLRQAELNLVAETLNADLAAVRLLKAVGAFKEAYQ
jgi:outer membrane protein TolC